MIDIKNIFSTNMEMLEQQERELSNALSIVQQIRKMLSSQSGGYAPIKKGKGRPAIKPAVDLAPPAVAKRRGRPVGFSPKKTAASAAAKPASVITNAHVPAGKRPPRKGSWLDQIFKILESNGPTASGKIIEMMFKSQKEIKKITEFRKLIFPVFTRAYRDKFLVNKNGIVHFAKP